MALKIGFVSRRWKGLVVLRCNACIIMTLYLSTFLRINLFAELSDFSSGQSLSSVRRQ